jgi:hypothetical protein
MLSSPKLYQLTKDAMIQPVGFSRQHKLVSLVAKRQESLPVADFKTMTAIYSFVKPRLT